MTTDPPRVITCIECGGDAHLISFLPQDEPVDPGTPIAYRCSRCMDRFDVIWDDDSG